MFEFLNDIDTSVFLFFNGLHCPLLDRFMFLFTGRFIWIPMYVTIFLLLLRQFGLRRVWIYAMAIALAIMLTDQIASSILRPVFQRLRPANPDNPLSFMTHIVNGYRGGSYGFPSCHAGNSFALATFLAVIFRRRHLSMVIFGWAILNSYTRLYLGVHYPGDLLAGAAIGSIFACAAGLIARKVDYAFLRARKKAADGLRNTEEIYRPMLRIPFGANWAGIAPGTFSISPFGAMLLVGAITVFAILFASI